MSLIDRIPGYREALEREATARAIAWLALEHAVCGIELCPLTPRRLLRLSVAGNAFICGGQITTGHVAAFLWACSPRYSLDSGERRKFLGRVKKLAFGRAVREIHEYLDEMFLDAPPGKSSEKSLENPVTFAAVLINRFASAYGWSMDQILDMPMPCLFQLGRCLELSSGGKPVFISAWSARVRGDYLSALNASGGKANG